MKKLNLLAIAALSLLFSNVFAQLPAPALLGYWQNWDLRQAPYFALDQADSRYNTVALAFAVPRNGTDYDMEFSPLQTTAANLRTQVQALQAQGRKVIISIGGANHPISLSNTTERDVFVSSMNNIINYYGFDGLDIDVEGGSLSVTTGTTISNPTDAPVVHLISAIKSIMLAYRQANSRKLLLTMAPETAYVQGGQSSYGGVWGAYLPVIHALRDSIDMLNVQLYNSGTMYGIDRGIYTQGTADFIVALTEAVIRGFPTNGGFFTGLPAHKIGVGLPACSDAAGGGYVAPATVKAAVDYLRGTGPKPGTYTLVQSGGYPDLRGMMTWSINWDRVSTCGGTYAFAQNFETIFGTGGGGQQCTTPAAPTFTGITTNSATATWPAVSGATAYNFRFKAATASTYTTVQVSTNSYNMTGLASATSYVADVQTICTGGNSGISMAASFVTLPLPGECVTPAGLLVKNIKFNSATASWSAVSGVTSYELQYKVKSAATWISRVQTGTSAALSGLTAGTTYEVRVRSICPGNVYSLFSTVVEFITPAKGGKSAVDLITASRDALILELGPNPARDFLMIRTNLAPGHVLPYRLVNAAGQPLQSGVLSGALNTLDVSALKQGIYLIQAGSETRRFVKLP